MYPLKHNPKIVTQTVCVTSEHLGSDTAILEAHGSGLNNRTPIKKYSTACRPIDGIFTDVNAEMQVSATLYAPRLTELL